jgi:hypothetical protein
VANSSHRVATKEMKTAVGMVHGERVTSGTNIKLGPVHRLSALSALLSETPLRFRSAQRTPVGAGEFPS